MDDIHFPTPEESKRHFNAQDKSVFRPPYHRDPGVTILNDAKEAKALIQAELAGHEVSTFKSRNPATTYPDPAAELQKKIRAIHRDKLPADKFRQAIASPIDYLLYEIAYGDQSSNQRSKNLVALAKLLHDEQKRIDEQVHRERQIEAKKTDQLLKAGTLQEQIINNAAKRDALKARSARKAPPEVPGV